MTIKTIYKSKCNAYRVFNSECNIMKTKIYKITTSKVIRKEMTVKNVKYSWNNLEQ